MCRRTEEKDKRRTWHQRKNEVASHDLTLAPIASYSHTYLVVFTWSCVCIVLVSFITCHFEHAQLYVLFMFPLREPEAI